MKKTGDLLKNYLKTNSYKFVGAGIFFANRTRWNREYGNKKSHQNQTEHSFPPFNPLLHCRPCALSMWWRVARVGKFHLFGFFAPRGEPYMGGARNECGRNSRNRPCRIQNIYRALIGFLHRFDRCWKRVYLYPRRPAFGYPLLLRNRLRHDGKRKRFLK